MAHVIAVAGKGGVGKTTLCGMLIQYLCEQGKGPILAVDADANSNLNEVLGVEVETTLGDVREEIAQAELVKESPIPKGMSKADYAEKMILICWLWAEPREKAAIATSMAFFRHSLQNIRIIILILW